MKVKLGDIAFLDNSTLTNGYMDNEKKRIQEKIGFNLPSSL